MKETQTPRKDISYRRPKDSPSSKTIFDQSKKNQKIARKSLTSEFASVSEDLLSETASESFNLSQLSEVLSENNIRESLDSFESLIGAENQPIITSEEVSTQSESTPRSKIATAGNESVNLSLDCSKTSGSNNSIEADVVVDLLKQAKTQVSSSSDVSAESKKLLDALVEVSVRDLCALPEEEDIIDWLLSRKLRVVIVCSVVWLITMISIVFRCSGIQSSSSFNPSPT